MALTARSGFVLEERSSASSAAGSDPAELPPDWTEASAYRSASLLAPGLGGERKAATVDSPVAEQTQQGASLCPRQFPVLAQESLELRLLNE